MKVVVVPIAVWLLPLSHIALALLWNFSLCRLMVLVCLLVIIFSHKSYQYMQACTARCLWRPILIVCIWSLVLCNGKRTPNALPRPFCTFLISHQIGIVCFSIGHRIGDVRVQKPKPHVTCTLFSFFCKFAFFIVVARLCAFLALSLCFQLTLCLRLQV